MINWEAFKLRLLQDTGFPYKKTKIQKETVLVIRNHHLTFNWDYPLEESK
jgi:hypothetical protein